MFKFEHPTFLYFLLAVPLFVAMVAIFWQWRKATMQRFGDSELVMRLLSGFSTKRILLKTSLFALSLGLLGFALANPQRGGKREKVTQKSADIFIALDISQSMLAEDIAPSRLDRAKVFAEKLVQNLPGQRIGLIFFAGGAYLQMPLSTDYNAAISYLRSASPDMVSEQGTAIAEAIGVAEQSFDPKAPAGRAIVVITDGETHDDDAIAKAENAQEAGIVTYAIGVGTAEGAPIPVGLALNGAAYKRDENGEVVKTKLNEKLLYDLAKGGGGTAHNLAQGDAVLTALRESLDKLQKKEVEARSFTEFESYFQWFLLPALLLLALEFLLPWQGSVGIKSFFK